jgi:hypothetical protein
VTGIQNRTMRKPDADFEGGFSREGPANSEVKPPTFGRSFPRLDTAGSKCLWFVCVVFVCAAALVRGSVAPEPD